MNENITMTQSDRDGRLTKHSDDGAGFNLVTNINVFSAFYW